MIIQDKLLSNPLLRSQPVKNQLFKNRPTIPTHVFEQLFERTNHQKRRRYRYRIPNEKIRHIIEGLSDQIWHIISDLIAADFAKRKSDEPRRAVKRALWKIALYKNTGFITELTIKII